MPQKAAKYLHRKCRREACSKWSLFRASDPRPVACTFCQAPYGPLELGMDVQDATTSEPDLKGRDAPQKPLTKLPDVRPGDFEYVPPTDPDR